VQHLQCQADEILTVPYPPDETVPEYIQGFMTEGLFELLTNKGRALSTDALRYAFARHLQEELFAEGTPLGALRDAPATALESFAPEAIQLLGRQCSALTTAMATTIAGEGALCADHLRKL
jgi:hypothetical protein